MPTDREAAGAGSFGVSQHAQEAGFLSARSAGHRHREETCKRHLFFFFFSVRFIPSFSFFIFTFSSHHVSNMPHFGYGFIYKSIIRMNHCDSHSELGPCYHVFFLCNT